MWSNVRHHISGVTSCLSTNNNKEQSVDVKEKKFLMVPSRALVLIFLGSILTLVSICVFNHFSQSHVEIVPKNPFSMLPAPETYYHSLTTQVEKTWQPAEVPFKLNEEEALATMRVAKEFANAGSYEKALKLIKHAYLLQPNHPDILTAYGEFIERYDVVHAEHLYSKAIMMSPEHSRAMTNRARTLPLVEEIDERYFSKLDKMRDQLLSVSENNPGLRRAKWESYFQFIYHTNAIEGNTMSLMETRSIVETRLAIGGKSLQEHNEILGMDAALKYINSTLITKLGPITTDDILEIHKRVLGHVDPVLAGVYRNTQVFVGDFIPPSPTVVNKHMQEFIVWLNSREALNLHPIKHAALAHYKLVIIHPFFDGNGRTSRLLMNLILMRSGYPPVLIPVHRKHEYYKHLQTGNAGDIRPFIRFTAKCTEDTLNHFLQSSIQYSSVVIKRPAQLPSTFYPSIHKPESSNLRIVIPSNSHEFENSQCLADFQALLKTYTNQ